MTTETKKMVIGLFEHYDDAVAAVKYLIERGFIAENMSCIGREEVLSQGGAIEESDPLADTTRAGVIGGTAAGGLTGLLLGLTAITLPGIGPVITAGALAVAGAGIGATAGGLFGLLSGTSTPIEDTRVYSGVLERGGVLLAVQADDDRVVEVTEALHKAAVVDIDTESDEWHNLRWNRLDQNMLAEAG